MQIKLIKIFIVLFTLISIGKEQNILAKNKSIKRSQIKWGSSVSENTLYGCRWYGQVNWFEHYKSGIDEKAMLIAMVLGTYKTLSPKKFLKLNIENDRARAYPNAKRPEEFYPPHDSPRGTKEDLLSLYYHATTKNSMSPIGVARVTCKDGKTRLFLLDGMHRRIAAILRKSKIKFLLIDL